MVNKRSAERQAVAELCGAAVLWGFGFIATVWALKAWTPLWMTVFRFLGAALAGFVGLAAFGKALDTKHFKLSFVPGLFLGGTLMLQTVGLVYTTASKSAFITTLYIIIIPLFEALVLKKRLHPLHGLMVAVATLGAALMCRLAPGVSLADLKGDLLTLGCSVCAAAQILWLGRIGRKVSAPVAFNTYQAFWTGITALPLALLFEGPFKTAWNGLFTASPQALWGGLVFLIFGSTHIAFLAQVRAQKVISPSVASMLFLLESPFSALFAAILLGERLDSLQMVGAALILAAAAGVVHLETRS